LASWKGRQIMEEKQGDKLLRSGRGGGYWIIEENCQELSLTSLPKICPNTQSARTPPSSARTFLLAARVVLRFSPFSIVQITWSPSRKLFLRH
jgi:hypothetical protein